MQCQVDNAHSLVKQMKFLIPITIIITKIYTEEVLLDSREV